MWPAELSSNLCLNAFEEENFSFLGIRNRGWTSPLTASPHDASVPSTEELKAIFVFFLSGVTPTQKWTLEEGPLGHVSTMSANMHPITVEREDQEFELDLIF